MPAIDITDWFENNLALLRECDPALARRVEKVPFPESVEVSVSKDGLPVPRLESVFLHSSYRPREEAARMVSDFETCKDRQTVVYGLGFGYHVLELLKMGTDEVVVIEPLMSVFRAFLSGVDLSDFIPATKFIIAEPPPRILARLATLPWNVFEHKPSVRIESPYFIRLEKGREVSRFLGNKGIKVLIVPPFYGGSLPTARYCARALENLGHEVSVVNCDKFSDSFFAVSNVTRNKENSELLNKLFMNFMGQVIAARAAEFAPDLILTLAQAPMTPETIGQLKCLGAPVAFWFVEDFRTLTYWDEIARHYDYFFTIQRGEFFEKLDSAGCVNHYYLPQACLPEVHKPLNLSPEDKQKYSCGLSFMGAAYYNRMKCFPRLMDFDFRIWGTEWDLNSDVGKLVRNNNERVSSEDVVKIYNAGKINLNLHSSTFHEEVNPLGDFINPRTFEIAACSGFQLVDEREELHDLFREGEEMVTFKSIGELRKKISYYMEHEEERKSVAAKARARVLKEHTFESRMSELLIQVFVDDLEKLRRRVEQRVDRVDYFIEQAGVDTELGKYLERFRGVPDFSLNRVMKEIEGGEGTLTKNELLMLMLDQVVKEGA